MSTEAKDPSVTIHVMMGKTIPCVSGCEPWYGDGKALKKHRNWFLIVVSSMKRKCHLLGNHGIYQFIMNRGKTTERLSL